MDVSGGQWQGHHGGEVWEEVEKEKRSAIIRRALRLQQHRPRSTDKHYEEVTSKRRQEEQSGKERNRERSRHVTPE